MIEQSHIATNQACRLQQALTAVCRGWRQPYGIPEFRTRGAGVTLQVIEDRVVNSIKTHDAGAQASDGATHH